MQVSTWNDIFERSLVTLVVTRRALHYHTVGLDLACNFWNVVADESEVETTFMCCLPFMSYCPWFSGQVGNEIILVSRTHHWLFACSRRIPGMLGPT